MDGWGRASRCKTGGAAALPGDHRRRQRDGAHVSDRVLEEVVRLARRQAETAGPVAGFADPAERPRLEA